MSRFETLRNLLPSLYRPELDDTDGVFMPLAAEHVLQINGAAPQSVTVSGMSALVTLAEAARVRQVQLDTASAGGSSLVLEVYRVLSDHSIPARPVEVAALHNGRAALQSPMLTTRFALRLKRPGLLTQLLRAGAATLDGADRDATFVLQSHWFNYANSSLFMPFSARTREILDQAPPKPGDDSVMLYPYNLELARLASLVALPPWREPPSLRETVEEHRLRVRRTIDTYRNGLGTLAALRSIVQANLPLTLPEVADGETPEERTQRLELQDTPFWIEEFAQLFPRSRPAETAGPPQNLVGPLMRWEIDHHSRQAALPTLYIEGQTPVPEEIDATVNPVIERYDPVGLSIGLAYEGTIAPGQTLRLSPVGQSWLGTENGLRLAESHTTPVNPTAPGPWADVNEGPSAPVRAMAQTPDLRLWVVTQADAGSAFWIYDGTAWENVLNTDFVVHALAVDGSRLLVGGANGLHEIALYTGDPYVINAVEGVNTTVYALARIGDDWVLGTENGIVGGAFTSVTGTPIYCIHDDGRGTIYFGGELGVFLYQMGYERWYWYHGESASDQTPDWEPLGASLPASESVFLPPVISLCRAPDSSLWVGTPQGAARYYAREISSLAYTTQLEAFPDLMDGPVNAIVTDVNGIVWFATSRGLFRYDGRDLWQSQSNAWVKKGRADKLYTGHDQPAERGLWRYARGQNRWEQYNATNGTWEASTEPRRSTDETPISTMAWTLRASAALGTWDGSVFTPTAEAVPGTLRVRFKPAPTRILDGGIPALPRLPVGISTWRYLQLEPEALPPPGSTPAWTMEGRLIPMPEQGDPHPGRYDYAKALFDEAVYAFNPAARVTFTYTGGQLLTCLVRLIVDAPAVDPAVLERVQQGIERVRPAGVQVVLAVNDELVGA